MRFTTSYGYTLYLWADGTWRDAPNGNTNFDMEFDSLRGAPVGENGVLVEGTLTVKFTWNTGAHYQAEGQVITVSFDGTQCIFADHSRMITGVMREYPGEFVRKSVRDYADWFHYRYLRNQYGWSNDANKLRRLGDPTPGQYIEG